MAVSDQFTNVFQGYGNNFELLAGGKVYVTDVSSGDPVTTWSDFEKTVPNAHPVILSASGKAVIILDDGPVNIELTDSLDATIYTINNYDVSVETIIEPVLQDAFLSFQQACLTSELNAAESADLIKDDLALTNADVVLTHADVVLTNADVVSTGNDVTATNADVVLTGLDVDDTNADVVTAGNSATSASSSATLASQSATIAASAANNKGAWDALTGALAIPASVTHDEKLWVLENSLADVTAHEPGVSAEWTLLTGFTAIVDDTSPQLGGDLDLNSFDIPISPAQQTALNLKANLASPSLTGTPLAPTAVTTTNTTQVATTAFVQQEITANAGMADLIDDTTPQLGGDLDSNGKTFNGSSYTQIADASVGVALHTFAYANGDMQQHTSTGAGTIAFSGFPTGKVVTFIIDAVDWGDYTPTNLAAVLNSGADIAFTSGGTDRLLLIKDKDDLYDLVRMIENMGGA